MNKFPVLKSLVLAAVLLAKAFQARAEEVLTFTAIEGYSHTFICERVLAEAYGRLGIRIVVKPLPNERALEFSNSGKVDGELYRIAGLEKNYHNLIMIPVRVDYGDGVAFTKGEGIRVQGWDSLKPYRVAIQRGTKFAEKGTEGLNPILVNSNEQLFELLDMGRVDVAVLDHITGLKLLRKLNLKDIRALPDPLASVLIFNYLHRKNEHLVPRITAALQAMEQEGRILKIRDQAIQDWFKTP